MTDTEINNSNQAMPFSKKVEVAAYPISLAVGVYTLYHAARRGAFDHLKNSKWLGEELETALQKHREKGEEIGLEGYKVIHDFHESFSEKIGIRMRELGIDNPIKLWNCNYHDQQIKRLVEGFTALSISLGGLLMAADHLKSKEDNLAKRVDKQIKQKENHIAIER